MNYTWLLLDADGTLFDYDRAEAKALAASFEANDIPFTNGYAKEYRRINAQIWSDFEHGKISQQDLRSERFGRLFLALDIDADPLTFSDTYLTNLGNAADMIDGAEELLQALYGRYKLLLITNGIPEVQRSRLAISRIGPFFEAIIISGEVGIAKPHRGIFDAAFEAMNHPPKSQTLIIGDSLTSDIQGGLNYGIDTCWYNPQQRVPTPGIRATYEAHSLTQLRIILTQ